jgi:3-methyladenine DNA glycosylase/8-oxoguanine DNA glycosylase
MTDLPRGLGAPAERAFAQAGFTTIEQFADVTEKELLRLHGVGPRAIRLLRAALETYQLTFRTP